MAEQIQERDGEQTSRRETSYPNAFRNRAHSLSRNMGASMHPPAQA